MREITGGELYPTVLDATGSAASMNQALNYVAHAGTLVYVGITTQDITFPDRLFHSREMTLKASRNALPDDFRRIIQLIEDRQIDTTRWITHRTAFDEVIDVFESYTKPETGVIKAIIDLQLRVPDLPRPMDERRVQRSPCLYVLCGHKLFSSILHAISEQFSTLGLQPSFGFGDRIGLATPGHIEAMKRAGAGIAPIFAQQSIREMTRTGRTPRESSTRRWAEWSRAIGRRHPAPTPTISKRRPTSMSPPRSALRSIRSTRPTTSTATPTTTTKQHFASDSRRFATRSHGSIRT